jgi:hypothetical protein
MFADIGEYIAELADNWAAFMTGGIAAALVLVIERLRKDRLWGPQGVRVMSGIGLDQFQPLLATVRDALGNCSYCVLFGRAGPLN